VNLTFTFTFLW